MTIASLTGAACSRGVYFIANDAVIDIAIAFLNSFRRHNAAMPLCMIHLTNRFNGFSLCVSGSTLRFGRIMTSGAM